MTKTIALPPLPYPYHALEPYIDEETLHIHHDKHFQTYIDKYNGILESNGEISSKSLTELLANVEAIPSSVKTGVINQGGGVYNHDFYFNNLSPDGSKAPIGNLKVAIESAFGSVETFQAEFGAAAGFVFGSGWTWLVKKADGTLEIMSTPNQETPISKGYTPIITIDVWEHAYYLKYQNRRPEYINAFFSIINWDRAEQLFNGELEPVSL